MLVSWPCSCMYRSGAISLCPWWWCENILSFVKSPFVVMMPTRPCLQPVRLCLRGLRRAPFSFYFFVQQSLAIKHTKALVAQLCNFWNGLLFGPVHTDFSAGLCWDASLTLRANSLRPYTETANRKSKQKHKLSCMIKHFFLLSSRMTEWRS